MKSILVERFFYSFYKYTTEPKLEKILQSMSYNSYLPCYDSKPTLSEESRDKQFREQPKFDYGYLSEPKFVSPSISNKGSITNYHKGSTKPATYMDICVPIMLMSLCLRMHQVPNVPKTH